eukprot:1190892-Prorocentrum_minimum.AAC.1
MLSSLVRLVPERHRVWAAGGGAHGPHRRLQAGGGHAHAPGRARADPLRLERVQPSVPVSSRNTSQTATCRPPTRTYVVRTELAGELNSRVTRWLDKVLTVNILQRPC